VVLLGAGARRVIVARVISRTFASMIGGGSGSAASDDAKQCPLLFRTRCHAQGCLRKLLN
jgi:hypothetical protein